MAIIACGFVLPLILIPVISIIGYSEIIEEAAKALVVFFIILKLSNLKQQITGVLIFGFLFGLSESMFYLNNIFQLGDFSVFWQRFLWTVPMHVVAAFVIFFFAKFRKGFIFAGFILAVILHILFNFFILKY